MIRVINKMLYLLKLLLLLVSFGFTFYIIVFMYQRLDKSLVQAIPVFFPYLLLFILFAINMIFDQQAVKNNFFYNFTSCLVFALFIYVGYRAVGDSYMIAKIRLGYNINFNYYSDMISPLQVMLYALSISNIFLMFTEKKKVKRQDDVLAPRIPEIETANEYGERM